MPPTPDMIGCPDCGLLQQLPPLSRGCIAECQRCHKVLARTEMHGAELALAGLGAAALLWIPTCVATLMGVSASSIARHSALTGGVSALWDDGYHSLGLLIAVLMLALPTLFFALMLAVLLSLQLQWRCRALAGRWFRWALALRPWLMLDVYVVGAGIAYSRMERIATVHVGVGGWCLFATTLCTLLALAELDEHAVWRRLPVRERAAMPGETLVLACRACDLVQHAHREGEPCARCEAPLQVRKPDALQRATALALCGLLLYIPANLLPVLLVVDLGRREPSTILSGAQQLIDLGLWPLAVIVFLASIVIPLLKLTALGCNLVLTYRGSRWQLRARTRVHRAVDAIGRWSNIDVFVLSILAALVQFGEMMHVYPATGMIAFAAVVVVTMLATRSFDTRLMWDAAGERR